MRTTSFAVSVLCSDMGDIPHISLVFVFAEWGWEIPGKGDTYRPLLATMGTAGRATPTSGPPLASGGADHATSFFTILRYMSKGRFQVRGTSVLEATLRRMVVVFRFLGWIWMLLLVIVTLRTDPLPPRLWIVYTSVALATAWTLLTWYVARRHPLTMAGSTWFVLDALAMLAVGAASVASGAGELFHGGLPLSLVFVGALWGGLPGSLIAALLLAAEQYAVHVIADLNPVRAAGSIIFFIVASIVGWTFDRLRDYDLARQRSEGELAKQQAAIAAHEARVDLIDRLHDSVLQTLHAIRMGADDPAQSRYLARRQERELRRQIEAWRSEFEQSFRAELLAVRDHVEDTHRIEIEAVIRDDAPLTSELSSAIDAAREAMTNAAKHARATTISVFSEARDGSAVIHVRDNGIGLTDRRQREEVYERLRQRLARSGGEVVIESGDSGGTDIRITVESPHV